MDLEDPSFSRTVPELPFSVQWEVCSLRAGTDGVISATDQNYFQQQLQHLFLDLHLFFLERNLFQMERSAHRALTVTCETHC